MFGILVSLLNIIVLYFNKGIKPRGLRLSCYEAHLYNLKPEQTTYF